MPVLVYLVLVVIPALALVPGCDTRPDRLSSSARQFVARQASGTSGADSPAGTRSAPGTSGADRAAPEQAAVAPGTSGADRAAPEQAAVAPGTSGADRALADSRQAAHRVLSRYCGGCHIGSSPEAKPEALAIFDLESPTWYRGFTPQRLASAKGRLDDKADDVEKHIFAIFMVDSQAEQP